MHEIRIFVVFVCWCMKIFSKCVKCVNPPVELNLQMHAEASAAKTWGWNLFFERLLHIKIQVKSDFYHLLNYITAFENNLAWEYQYVIFFLINNLIHKILKEFWYLAQGFIFH